MKTPCAFHQGHQITQFCKCPSCLLPLCPECLVIHLQQHQSLPEPIQLLPIENAVREISHSIAGQFKYIDAITVETVTKHRESEQQHKRVFQEILHNREAILKAVHTTFEAIFQEIQSNSRRRELWVRQFNQSVLQLKEQLTSLGNSLLGQKYLRVVIMWNRLKPHQAIEEITKKAQKKWLAPEFVGVASEQVQAFIANNTNLKVLEIEGDSGVHKILNIIRVLRYGESEGSTGSKTSSTALEGSNSSSSLGIIVTQQQQSQPLGASKNMNQHLPAPKQHIIVCQPTNTQQLKNSYQLHPTQAPTSPLSYKSPTTSQQPQTPMYFASSNRKTSSRKLQVLSSLEQCKTGSQVVENK